MTPLTFWAAIAAGLDLGLGVAAIVWLYARTLRQELDRERERRARMLDGWRVLEAAWAQEHDGEQIDVGTVLAWAAAKWEVGE